MKKYKLIKKYPGSPKLGYIYKSSDPYFESDYSYCKLADYPTFWQEIIEKDYEILSFKDKQNSQIITLRSNGYYVLSGLNSSDCPNNKGASLEEELAEVEKDDYIIYSVKRLSDGEVFTVGDKIKGNFIDMTIKIIDFSIAHKNKIAFYPNSTITSHILLSAAKHIKKPLFTTEDGVDIFEGDTYWWVNTNFWKAQKEKITSIREHNTQETGYNVGGNFSTKEKAEEYILMNKPCLSFKDIMDISEPYTSKKWLEEKGYIHTRINTFKFKKSKLKELIKLKL